MVLSLSPESLAPSLSQAEKSFSEAPPFNDDIIAVRKLDGGLSLGTPETESQAPLTKKSAFKTPAPRFVPQEEEIPQAKAEPQAQAKMEPLSKDQNSLMMFLVAKENRKFAGYELLQTVLASGLRFGEGHLFYRHQFANGQGPVVCGLAAATASGVFDMQNIGGFSVRGLCLFMHAANNPSIDAERFSIMLDTARQLSEGLDAYLLDDQRKPLTQDRIIRYCRLLRIEMPEEESI